VLNKACACEQNVPHEKQWQFSSGGWDSKERIARSKHSCYLVALLKQGKRLSRVGRNLGFANEA